MTQHQRIKAPSQRPASLELQANWRDADVESGFTVIAVGDIIITHAIRAKLARRSPELLAILSRGDVVVGNYEGSAIDLRRFDGHPEAQSGFAWLTSDPECPADLAALGFNLMARANNHALDWGAAGMAMTDDLLDAAGIAHAGTGASLAAARAPAFLNTAKARVALLSHATTFEGNAPANDGLGAVPPRPGLNPLRTTAHRLVSADDFAVLKRLNDQEAFQDHFLLRALYGQHSVHLGMALHYRVDPEARPGSLRIVHECDPRDLGAIERNLRQAKQTSDFAIVAQHTHEPDNFTTEVPGYLPALARKLVDGGADMLCGHGPHQLRGIEIYRGKPLLYSLGNFCFMDNTQQIVPRDEWEEREWMAAEAMVGPKGITQPNVSTPAEFLEWKRVVGIFSEPIWFESVVAECRFGAHGRLEALLLHPIELGFAGRDAERGIPRLAFDTEENGAQARRILERLQALSSEFGTRIEIETVTFGERVSSVGRVCLAD
ncbi:CapA family protein [Paraburkholderia acidisoli]|uniref:CapA family protein n=1 Tax=Paraburkholderia acidisoli TaxID=2571748 RepID=A0A7Z2GQQ8_9BURK|nr:CapA family protein [Paraburkholderia acidisoli]QGZ66147.1 CapA family protein [Paraburkholderia acidisoli]